MEENIIISNLNDFIFCPRSIYFHNLYYNFENKEYTTTYQEKGKFTHKNIDNKKYSSKKQYIESIDVYSEELGLIGKIDILDIKNKILIERKNKITRIYEGYYLQVYAQYFCLIEMGYKIDKIKLYSVSDNKNYYILLPGKKEKNKLKEIINKIKNFDLNTEFTQNLKKCKMCIYKNICDYYDE